MARPLIAITFPNHWSIKNLIHSGVIAELQSVADIQGWASADRIPHLEDLCNEFGLAPIQWVATADSSETKALKRIRHLQKSLLFESHGVSTERILQRSERGKRTKLQQLGSAAMRSLSKTPWAPALKSWISKRRWELTPESSVAFPEVPNLLFVTNPVDFREDPLVKSARLAGVPVVTMVPSWDNLSSKGVLFGSFERVYVWNEVMHNEVRQLYPEHQASQVQIVGVPRFQAYESSPRADRNQFLQSLGLDPDRRTILFANTATKSFPDQPTVAHHVAEAVSNGELEGAQLLVRCHPHDDSGDYDFLRGLPHVAVWPEPGQDQAAFGVQTVPPADDLRLLTATLRSADVCVNSASTIALDAAANDVPIVSVAYDGNRKRDYPNSVRSYYDYTHQRPFIATRASVLVESRQSLIEALRCALENPELRREERAQLARIATPGQPATRLAEDLMSLVAPSLSRCA